QVGRAGVDPHLLVRRLERENNVSARRALILGLGEYTGRDLPTAARASLVKRLLRWYRDDPDAGGHGAIGWLLRHGKEGPDARPRDWGQRAELGRIDRELARRDTDGGRGWFVNRQGQTFTRIQGPVEFRMGSPLWEPNRLATNEKPHRRVIGRSFALA